jgi:tetratricopeptide (TPR) repeat protein
LIGAGAGLLRLGRIEDARKHADLAVSVAPGGAHELLAKIALARHDRDEALREAKLAQEADPTLPMPLYVEGLLLYNQGRYADALGPLLSAHEALKTRTVQMNELDYYIGDSFARLERYREAEPFFLEGIHTFPHDLRARAGLAMLYRATGRDADADRVVEELLLVSPTPEGRALASKLWTMFGEPERARQVRIP